MSFRVDKVKRSLFFYLLAPIMVAAYCPDGWPAAPNSDQKLATYFVSYYPGDKKDDNAAYYDPYYPSQDSRDNIGTVPKGRSRLQEYRISKKKKLQVSELTTFCIPACDVDGNPKGTAFLRIIPVNNPHRRPPYILKCKHIGKRGFVGTVLHAIDLIEGRPVEKLPPYSITRVKAPEGLVEVKNYINKWGKDENNRLVMRKEMGSTQYIGNSSPKDRQANIVSLNPCGGVESSCFDPHMAVDEYGVEPPTATYPCDCSDGGTPPVVQPAAVRTVTPPSPTPLSVTRVARPRRTPLLRPPNPVPPECQEKEVRQDQVKPLREALEDNQET